LFQCRLDAVVSLCTAAAVDNVDHHVVILRVQSRTTSRRKAIHNVIRSLTTSFYGSYRRPRCVKMSRKFPQCVTPSTPESVDHHVAILRVQSRTASRKARRNREPARQYSAKLDALPVSDSTLQAPWTSNVGSSHGTLSPHPCIASAVGEREKTSCACGDFFRNHIQ